MQFQVIICLLAVLSLVEGSIRRGRIPFFNNKESPLQVHQSQQVELELPIQEVDAPILPRYITKTTIITKDIQKGTTNGLTTTTIRRKVHVEVNEQFDNNRLDRRQEERQVVDPIMSSTSSNSISIVTVTITYDFYLGYNSDSSIFTLQNTADGAPSFTLTSGYLSQYDSSNTIGYMGDPDNGFFGIPTDDAFNVGVGAVDVFEQDTDDSFYIEQSMTTDGILTGGGSSLTWINGDFAIANNQVVWCTVDGNNVLLAQASSDPGYSCTSINVYLAPCMLFFSHPKCRSLILSSIVPSLYLYMAFQFCCAFSRPLLDNNGTLLPT